MKKLVKTLVSTLLGVGLVLTATACSQLNCIEIGDVYSGSATSLTYNRTTETVYTKTEVSLERSFSEVEAVIEEGTNYDSIRIKFKTQDKTTRKVTPSNSSTTTTTIETDAPVSYNNVFPLYKQDDKIFIIASVPTLVTKTVQSGNTVSTDEVIDYVDSNIELNFDGDQLSFVLPTAWKGVKASDNSVIDVIENVNFSFAKQK